jgi:hypothetical protein
MPRSTIPTQPTMRWLMFLMTIPLVGSLVYLVFQLSKDNQLANSVSMPNKVNLIPLPTYPEDNLGGLITDLSQNKMTVESYVASQAFIRIMIDAGPGFGNQAANANLIKRLRSLGFAGMIELIYLKKGQDKIFSLFHIPKQSPDDFIDEESHIRFLSLAQFYKARVSDQVKGIALGMAGALDMDLKSMLLLDNLHAAILHSNFTNKETDFFNVATFVVMSSYYAAFPTRIFTPDADLTVNDQLKYLVTPTSTFAEANAVLTDQRDGRIFLKQKPALGPLFEAINKKNSNYIPMYGYPLVDSDPHIAKVFGYKHLMWPYNLLEVIAGARYAQIHGDEHLQRAISLLLFYDVNAKMLKQLNDKLLADHWGSAEVPGAREFRETLRSLDIANHLRVININNVSTAQQMHLLLPGQLLLILLGSLPQNIFEALYAHTDSNVVMHVREGASSLTSLVMTGQPHLRCAAPASHEHDMNHAWELGYDLASEVGARKQVEEMHSYHGLFCNGIDKWVQANVAEKVGKYILDAHDLQSPLSRYFKRLKQEASLIKNDRIYQVLTKVINLEKKKNSQRSIFKASHSLKSPLEKADPHSKLKRP